MDARCAQISLKSKIGSDTHLCPSSSTSASWSLRSKCGVYGIPFRILPPVCAPSRSLSVRWPSASGHRSDNSFSAFLPSFFLSLLLCFKGNYGVWERGEARKRKSSDREWESSWLCFVVVKIEFILWFGLIHRVWENYPWFGVSTSLALNNLSMICWGRNDVLKRKKLLGNATSYLRPPTTTATIARCCSCVIFPRLFTLLDEIRQCAWDSGARFNNKVLDWALLSLNNDMSSSRYPHWENCQKWVVYICWNVAKSENLGKNQKGIAKQFSIQLKCFKLNLAPERRPLTRKKAHRTVRVRRLPFVFCVVSMRTPAECRVTGKMLGVGRYQSHRLSSRLIIMNHPYPIKA